MKKTLPLLLAFTLVFLFSCNNSSETQTEEKKPLGQLVELTIPIDGMTCGGCENTVNTQLLNFDGVVESRASHVKKNVIVKVDTLITSVDEMRSEIERVGYKLIK